MTGKQKSWGMGLSFALMIGGIGLILLGHGRISVACFVLAGVGFGIFGPGGFSGGTHGASDST